MTSRSPMKKAWERGSRSLQALAPVAGAFFYLSLLGCSGLAHSQEKPKAQDPAAEITAVEERLLEMAPFLKDLERKLADRGYRVLAELCVPGAKLIEAEKLPPADSRRSFELWGASRSVWEKPAQPPAARHFDPQWNAPLQWIARLLPEPGWAKIKTIDGELVPHGDSYAFRTHHRLYLRPAKGQPLSQTTVEVTIDWGFDGKQLRGIRWETGRIVHLAADDKTARSLLATESLEEAIPDPALLDSLRQVRHEEFLRGIYANPLDLRRIANPNFPFPYVEDITFEAGEQHPAVSVVDINEDGWDDLYVMQRWGPNRLLVNQQNGTFTDEAAAYGLDVEGLCSCALFIDFDNDGDQDLFLGRTLERSRLYEQNEENRFVNVSHRIDAARLPHLVSTAAAADYDGDGFVDLYLGTYYGHIQSRGEGWQEKYLEAEDVPEYARRSVEKTDLFYNFAGPPNLLLRNTGGCRFERAIENDAAALWRSTFQTSWSDWDQDGDPDLMVTNDFGPDALLENRVDDLGRRSFVDVTQEKAPGLATNYFGMGASWGDYNLDGRQDLYLSAMFSKAGTRITNRLSEFQPRARQSALGNLLLTASESGEWVQRSGREKGQQPVDQVGWAWGGQFFDPNNDGCLDLYAPTGYFTPPKEFASDADL